MPVKKLVHSEQFTVNGRKEEAVRRPPSAAHQRRRRFGFTLIELMVVIAVIGVLAAFALAKYSAAQAKGRDAKRKTDIEAINKAIELFTDDTQGGAKYPIGPNLATALEPAYMKKVPTDPKTNTPYLYTANCSTGGNTPDTASDSDCTEYNLAACLENNNDFGNKTYPKPQLGQFGTNCPSTTARVYAIDKIIPDGCIFCP